GVEIERNAACIERYPGRLELGMVKPERQCERVHGDAPHGGTPARHRLGPAVEKRADRERRDDEGTDRESDREDRDAGSGEPGPAASAQTPPDAPPSDVETGRGRASMQSSGHRFGRSYSRMGTVLL